MVIIKQQLLASTIGSELNKARRKKFPLKILFCSQIFFSIKTQLVPSQTAVILNSYALQSPNAWHDIFYCSKQSLKYGINTHYRTHSHNPAAQRGSIPTGTAQFPCCHPRYSVYLRTFTVRQGKPFAVKSATNRRHLSSKKRSAKSIKRTEERKKPSKRC